MRMGLAIMGLIAMLGGLIGCQQKTMELIAKENPPPKPPHCPDLLELASLRLKDGSIADVRILQSDEFKFYIPASWYKGHFPDSNGRVTETDIGVYDPDLNEVECPGVVHRYVRRPVRG